MTATVVPPDATPASAAPRTLTIALVGNPNCGKTTLFNALTGLRQKVGNYPGVTVEKKEGRLALANGESARLLDLPGLYSLTPHSPDELIAREVLIGLRANMPRPDVIVNVVDASNLERNLYMTSQLLDIGLPVVIALTMTDTLDKAGCKIRADELAAAIGVPVVVVVASRREGLDGLTQTIARAAGAPAPPPAWRIPEVVIEEIRDLQNSLRREHGLDRQAAFAESVTLLMAEGDLSRDEHLSASLRQLAGNTRQRLLDGGQDFAALAIAARYQWVARVVEGVLHEPTRPRQSPLSANERIDRVVMHPFWGYVLFFCLMTLMFQGIFSWVKVPMDAIKHSVDVSGAWVGAHLPPGDLRDLIQDGVIAGVGNALVFLPQILLLFFFVSVLEDTGYMARAAFLMDRLMSKVGLHGKSFIPLLSSFACAIPGVMATRTIGDRKARLITILVAPLMSCSARLPVYLLMTTAFVPNRPVLRVFGLTLITLPTVTFVAMYFLGMAAAFCMAWLFHRTLLRGTSPTFLLELPPYRWPRLKTAVLEMIERAGLFLRRAGTLILAISVVLWALATFPKHPDLPPSQRLEQSFAGHLGHDLEPAIAPLGFDWKMGIGLVSSFAAREVFVSAMGTVYNVDSENEGTVGLQQKMREDTDPRTGQHVWSPLVAICLMVYYVLAQQCMSTVAVIRRETNGWKWAAFNVGYMTLLAWIVTFAVRHIGLLLGYQ